MIIIVRLLYDLTGIGLELNFLCHFNTIIKSSNIQVYRLLNKVDEALSDLNTAIQLSGGCGKAAENAFTQRGLILMLRGNEDDALEDFKVYLLHIIYIYIFIYL